mmetsp:Transcript_117173/g.378165  ORF Transcript_117173/g.378165 Transcript_117173/m.378165 type:complete len:227 (-) Transcript_117173:910-1590(-)
MGQRRHQALSRPVVKMQRGLWGSPGGLPASAQPAAAMLAAGTSLGTMPLPPGPAGETPGPLATPPPVAAGAVSPGAPASLEPSLAPSHSTGSPPCSSRPPTPAPGDFFAKKRGGRMRPRYQASPTPGAMTRQAAHQMAPGWPARAVGPQMRKTRNAPIILPMMSREPLAACSFPCSLASTERLAIAASAGLEMAPTEKTSMTGTVSQKIRKYDRTARPPKAQVVSR